MYTSLLFIFIHWFFLFSASSTLELQKKYTIEDGLPANQVRTLYLGNDGTMWAGTSNGPVWLTASGWQSDKGEQNPDTQGVSSISDDSHGRRWFGGLGFAHVQHGDNYTSYSISDMGLEGRVVFSFHEDQDQRVWAATTGGAAVFDGSWRSLTTEEGLKHNVVHDITQDQEGRLWFATRKGGLNIYDGTSWEYMYPDKNCRKLLTDHSGNIWVGTSSGLVRYDGNAWNVFREGSTVLPMAEDASGTIWCILNVRDVLSISTDADINIYENPAELSEGEVYAIAVTNSEDVWLSTDEGIFVYKHP